MFDANMKHLPAGHRGFANVNAIKSGGVWESLGINLGLVYFTVTEPYLRNGNSDRTACVTIHTESGDVVLMTCGEDRHYSRMMYEGSFNNENKVTDFINMKALQSAIAILKARGVDYTVGANNNIKCSEREGS